MSVDFSKLEKAIAYFNEIGMKPQEAVEKMIISITEKDFSYGSSKEACGTTRPHKD